MDTRKTQVAKIPFGHTGPNPRLPAISDVRLTLQLQPMSSVTRPLLEQLLEFDTALLANTISAIDPTPVDRWYMGGSIQSVTPGLGPTAAVAYTCELDSSTPGGTADLDD